MTRTWKFYQKEKNIIGLEFNNNSVGDIQTYHDLSGYALFPERHIDYGVSY